MVHRSNRCTVPLVSQWGKQDKKENDMSRKTKEAVQGVIYILPSFVLILIFVLFRFSCPAISVLQNIIL